MTNPVSAGASDAARTCRTCQATLSEQARFCHRCGTPVTGPARTVSGVQRSERNAWIVAGTIVALLLGMIVYRMMVDGPGGPRPPDMANAGNAAPGAAAATADPGGALPTAQAPDISSLAPAERFTRLYNRVMQAAANDDTTTVVNFTPMALGAYRQLETVSNDERYHAAVLNAQVGNMATALALTDTMLATAPNYLLAYVVRGEVARLRNDPAALARARAAFTAAYDREIASRKAEYVDHKNVLDDFRAR